MLCGQITLPWDHVIETSANQLSMRETSFMFIIHLSFLPSLVLPSLPLPPPLPFLHRANFQEVCNQQFSEFSDLHGHYICNKKFTFFEIPLIAFRGIRESLVKAKKCKISVFHARRMRCTRHRRTVRQLHIRCLTDVKLRVYMTRCRTHESVSFFPFYNKYIEAKYNEKNAY